LPGTQRWKDNEGADAEDEDNGGGCQGEAGVIDSIAAAEAAMAAGHHVPRAVWRKLQPELYGKAARAAERAEAATATAAAAAVVAEAPPTEAV
jgi:hypothetical protein